jgi:hypothetical protein
MIYAEYDPKPPTMTKDSMQKYPRSGKKSKCSEPPSYSRIEVYPRTPNPARIMLYTIQHYIRNTQKKNLCLSAPESYLRIPHRRRIPWRRILIHTRARITRIRRWYRPWSSLRSGARIVSVRTRVGSLRNLAVS